MASKIRLSAILILLHLICTTFGFSSKIKHVVVLMEENNSFDRMFGWYPGINGLTGQDFNLVDTKNPDSQKVYVDKNGKEIPPCGPDHSTPSTTSKIFGAAAVSKNDFSNPSMCGFVEWENGIGNAKTDYCGVMSMLTPDKVPVISTLASEFCIMDRFFSSYPGPTWPNRLFMLSATSAGLTETGPWYHNQEGKLFPQPTIFDQLSSEGLTWRNYYNDTPWELFLSSVAHNPEHVRSMEEFYADARKGNLPSFAWINPRSGINVTLRQGSNDQHPDHDIALGEAYIKDIYEALRSSPQWNETLMVITYDEHGGFYDHVPTPLNVPPPGDGEPSYPDKAQLFNRLGVRIPTLLISPWIPKGLVVSAPPDSQKPANNSEYELTSIISTTRKLLGMTSGPLTDRDAWSATFEHLFEKLEQPRTDCPVHLPQPPPPSTIPEYEMEKPVNDLQMQIMTMHSHLAGVKFPHHVEKQGQLSEWLQKHYHLHAHRTTEWKHSKLDAAYRVVCRPQIDPDWVDLLWTVNEGSSVSFNTISLRKLSTMCLDYGAKPVAGSVVSVSVCYPSADPDNNRDASQQWVWFTDSTVRPAANETLCLTSGVLEGQEQVSIQPCSAGGNALGLQQHWAYHGPADGSGKGDGHIYFGDFLNSLGVVNA